MKPPDCLPPRLLLDHPQVIGIHFGQHQRHVGSHTEGAGVRDHGAAGGGKFRLHLTGDGRIHAGEEYLRRGIGLGGRHDHPGDALGQRRIQPPLGGLTIRFAAGAVAGRKPRNIEPRMVFEQLNIALADHSSRAKDADWVFVFHGLDSIQCTRGLARPQRLPRPSPRVQRR